MPGDGVLPSWLLGPTLIAAAWAGIGPWALAAAAGADLVWTGTLPAGVIVASAFADHRLWLARSRPWHDWGVILLLLPAIGSSVWLTVGGLILDVGFSREELLGLQVGPGVALTGLLTTTISYHGRHHPDEARSS